MHNKAPRVSHLAALWALVKTSGNLSTPIVPTMKKKSPLVIIRLVRNNFIALPPLTFNELADSYGGNKADQCVHQSHIHKVGLL